MAFAEEYPVRHVLGGHIEMTRRPGVDYPIRTIYQPEEPPLEMDVADLRALRRAVTEVGDTPGVHPFERFCESLGAVLGDRCQASASGIAA